MGLVPLHTPFPLQERSVLARREILHQWLRHPLRQRKVTGSARVLAGVTGEGSPWQVTASVCPAAERVTAVGKGTVVGTVMTVEGKPEVGKRPAVGTGPHIYA